MLKFTCTLRMINEKFYQLVETLREILQKTVIEMQGLSATFIDEMRFTSPI